MISRLQSRNDEIAKSRNRYTRAREPGSLLPFTRIAMPSSDSLLRPSLLESWRQSERPGSPASPDGVFPKRAGLQRSSVDRGQTLSDPAYGSRRGTAPGLRYGVLGSVARSVSSANRKLAPISNESASDPERQLPRRQGWAVPGRFPLLILGKRSFAQSDQ